MIHPTRRTDRTGHMTRLYNTATEADEQIAAMHRRGWDVIERTVHEKSTYAIGWGSTLITIRVRYERAPSRSRKSP